MGRRFREVDLTVSIGLIEETESWNFALILVITEIKVGRRCSKHSFSITIDECSKPQVKEMKKLKLEIWH